VKIIPILLLSLFLVACDTIPKIPPITTKPVTLDSTALEQCPSLKEDITVSTFDQFIVVYGDLATMYGKCAGQQAGSVKLLKQFGNIK
jgi:hypothetical protein